VKHGLTIEGFGQAGNAKFAHIDLLVRRRTGL
jgi:hypothetical protein